jgi:chromosome segregation ATPase
MNFVGKVLIILNLVLCLMFMAFAGAVFTAQNDWGAALSAAKTKEVTLQSTIGESNAAYSNLKSDTDAELELRENRAKKAEADNMTLTTQLVTTQGERDQARTERNAAQTESKIASEESRDRIAESEQLRTVTSKLRAKIDTQIDVIRGQQDDIIARDRKLAQYELKQIDVLQKLANQERLLRFNDIDPDEIIDLEQQEPPPRVFGKVASARKNASRDTELVEVTIGSDDGLQKGHKLWVYRGEKFLADIRLIDVRPDRSVGEVITRAKNGVIGRGDNVASKL